jgi:uncharacterized flavoprotein (TIGR03862 family)
MLGAKVDLYEKMATPGRKLLVAGKGGLNLTHGGERETFAKHYQGADAPVGFWEDCLGAFDNRAMREWALGLGVETFEQRTGRVYPREMKAAGLLRRWLARLRESGVTFYTRHTLINVSERMRPELLFATPEGEKSIACHSAILAFGGASWPRTGSDGEWQRMLEKHQVGITKMQSANCGWECEWSADVLDRAEGLPLKNVQAFANEHSCLGELMVTRYGLEGGIIYQLGHALRQMAEPMLVLDLKPTFSVEQLRRKGGAATWRLSEAARALLDWSLGQQGGCAAERAKHLPIPLLGARPLAEAISSAGGVAWRSLDADLRLKNFRAIFCAGEMIDWEAPTGGYLLQGCLASGKRAAIAAMAACEKI